MKRATLIVARKDSVEVGLLAGQVEFFPDIFPMDADCPGGEVHDAGDFLGSLAQFDKVGDLNFRRR